MPLNGNAIVYVKSIFYALLGITLTILGIYMVGALSDFFKTNPFYAPIQIDTSLNVDVFGALVPVIIALISIPIFLKNVQSPIKKLGVAFFASLAFAFLLLHPTDDGLAGYPLLYSLIVSAIATAVNILPKSLFDLRKKLFASLLLSLSCVPLSLLSVDLYYSQFYSGSVIGGNGLSDGIFISTFYTPLSLVGVYSVLIYVSRTIWFIEKHRTVPTTKKATLNV